MNKMSLADLQAYYNTWVAGSKTIQQIANEIYAQVGSADPTGALAELIAAVRGEEVRTGLIHMTVLLLAYWAETHGDVEIAENALAEIKGSFELTENINNVKNGRYAIQSSGAIVPASERTWGMSEKIPIASDKTYTFAAYDFFTSDAWSADADTLAAAAPSFYVAWYDESGNLIKIVRNAPMVRAENHYSKWTINPTDANYGHGGSGKYVAMYIYGRESSAYPNIAPTAKLSISEGGTAYVPYIPPYTSADLFSRNSIAELSDTLKNLIRNNSYDIVPDIAENKTVAGVNIIRNGNDITLNGTASGVGFYNVFGDGQSIPDGITPGQSIYVKWTNDSDSWCTFQMRKTVNGVESSILTEVWKDSKTAVVKIPDEEGLTAIWGRIHWVADRIFDNTAVAVSVLTAPGNNDLQNEIDAARDVSNNLIRNNSYDIIPNIVETKTVAGINISRNGNDMTLNGTASEVGFYNVLGDGQSIPDGITPGQYVYIKWTNDSDSWCTFQFRKTVNGVETGLLPDLWKESKAAVVKIPDEEGLTAIWGRIHWYVDRVFDDTAVSVSVVTIPETTGLTEKDPPEPMLTLIDDDGALTFMTECMQVIAGPDAPTYDGYVPDETQRARIPVGLNSPISCPVTITRVGTGRDGTDLNWMTWDQIRQCAAKGAEILNHTYNHVPQEEDMSQSNQFTQLELERQYLMAKNTMQQNGVGGGDILIFNNASGDQPRCRKAAENTMRAAFHSVGASPVLVTSDPYYLKRYNISTVTSTSGTPPTFNFAHLKGLIDTAKSWPTGWMVWCFHSDQRYSAETGEGWRLFTRPSDTPIDSYTDSNGVTHYMYSTTEILYHAIKYAQEIGLPIVTADHGVRKYIERQ